MRIRIFALSSFIIVGFVTMILWQELTVNDGKLHIIFCNVGQGDAILIRTPNRSDILVDGGPDRKVLDCLSEHTPFWDRILELTILSHPHQDHFAGLIDVLKTYGVSIFATEKLNSEAQGFKILRKEIENKEVKTQYLFAGDSIKTQDGVVLKILAPSAPFLAKTSPHGEIGESGEFGSLVILLSYGDFGLLLTSDSQEAQLAHGIAQIVPTSLSVLQIPHHGSRTGLNKSLVDRLGHPKLSIISVGKNTYGHPHEEIMKILQDRDMKILRTDKDGEVELVSDGKTFTVHAEPP